MKNRTIKQLAASLLAVLSLFVSNIAACGCAHHQAAAKTEIPACHQAFHQNENANSQSQDSAQTNESKVFDASCVCFVQSAPKAPGNAETVKIQKQAALFVTEIDIVYGFAPARAPSAVRFDFSETALSDSAYNIKSPRAPPIL